MRLKYAAFLSLLAFTTMSANSAEKLSGIPSGTVKAMSCDEAARRYPEVLNGTASMEDMLVISAASNECAAAAFNKKAEQAKSDQRMLPTANVQNVDGKNTVVFGMVSFSPKDQAALRMVCDAAGGLVGASSPDPLMTQVVTAAGKYSCGSYVEALLSSNKLLLVAPTLLPGIDVTKDVLKAVGVSDKTIADIEKTVSKTVSTAATGAVQSGVAVATGGAVSVDKNLKCTKVFGRKVCR